MENLQHQNVQTERRVMSRIDAALRINYQIISDDVALNDPYDPNFVLPRYRNSNHFQKNSHVQA